VNGICRRSRPSTRPITTGGAPTAASNSARPGPAIRSPTSPSSGSSVGLSSAASSTSTSGPHKVQVRIGGRVLEPHTLRPPLAPRRPALPVPAAELAIPRSLPSCRRRRRRSRWSARSEARTNDLEARQDDGRTRPRGRPRIKDHRENHITRRALHRPRTTPAEPLDTKRLSFCRARQSLSCYSAQGHNWPICPDVEMTCMPVNHSRIIVMS